MELAENSGVPALGWSNTDLDPADPGRLCRGRERWIEPWEPDSPFPKVHRLVLSGARFSDDSARDAQRGLPFAGVDVPSVLSALFYRKGFLAFMEDGHPADIPEGAQGVEAYDGHRAGGQSQVGLVRWHRKIKGVAELRAVLGDDPTQITERIRGLLVLSGDEDEDALVEALFPLVGMSSLDSPPARYQPAALPDLVELVSAVVLFHRDKHGPALGIYSREPLDPQGKLEDLSKKAGCLLVKFAIPPMLARWDRALSELREEWSQTHTEPFPVPSSGEAPGWQPRRRRRRKPGLDELIAASNEDLEPGEANLDEGSVDDFLIEEEPEPEGEEPPG